MKALHLLHNIKEGFTLLSEYSPDLLSPQGKNMMVLDIIVQDLKSIRASLPEFEGQDVPTPLTPWIRKSRAIELL